MELVDKIPEMGPMDHEYSVLVVTAREPFLTWLTKAHEIKFGRQRRNPIHFEQEDPVFLVPYIGLSRFESESDFWSFVDELKPRMLRFVMNSYGLIGVNLPGETDSQLFDEFFQVRLRDTIFHYQVLDNFV